MEEEREKFPREKQTAQDVESIIVFGHEKTVWNARSTFKGR